MSYIGTEETATGLEVIQQTEIYPKESNAPVSADSVSDLPKREFDSQHSTKKKIIKECM